MHFIQLHLMEIIKLKLNNSNNKMTNIQNKKEKNKLTFSFSYLLKPVQISLKVYRFSIVRSMYQNLEKDKKKKMLFVIT